ncbi:MAG: divalent-cation tolerance protein CutA [Candidatus Methanoperedens sp.]|nr:divalent-cation tolerance protein CutA [Candidatus Methanoperedens sp.]MCE8428312.1 divalent-cation tolerance protein CutA [Candidatus Methanoperedens sp.]
MFSVIYITAGNMEEARKIGRTLVDEHLCACANIFPITSIYRWKGKIEEGSEFGIFIKTTNSNIKNIEKMVKQLHSYETPCVISLNIDEGSEDYLKWIEGSVHSEPFPIRKDD